MKHTQILCALVAIVCVAVLATAAMAAAPKLISYQGKATDASGNPVADGNHTVRFDLFSSATTGTSMWNEQTTVTTSAGLFTHQLGSVSPLPYYSFSGYEGLWLQLTFDGVIQTPRTQFTSVAYAFHVQSIHNSEGGNIKDGLAIYDPYTDNEIAGLMADGAGSSNLWLKGGDVDQSYRNVTLDAATASLTMVDKSAGYDTAKIAPNWLQIGDSTLRVSNDGITIGTANPSGFTDDLVRVQRQLNTVAPSVGLAVGLTNNVNTDLYGVFSEVGSSTDNGSRTGLRGIARNANASGGYLFGVLGEAGSSAKTSGNCFGVSGSASSGPGAYAVGVYGGKFGSGSGYAGFFEGNVNVNGTLSKSAGSFKIDHPLAPETKYLQHSFVESPDMKNIYDGVTTTDASGRAAVQLPDYFEALNMDFRYQLTVIGQFAQAIVAEKIKGNRFVIQTDEPDVEVSWQVTGVRKDAYAEANRIEVEVDKPADERGTYLAPEAHGHPLSKHVNWEHIKRALEDQSEREAQE